MKNTKNIAKQTLLTDYTHRELAVLFKVMSSKPGCGIVEYGCADDGLLGAALASHFPQQSVAIVADNLRDAKLARQHLQTFSVSNATVLLDDTLESVTRQDVDCVILKPSGYEGNAQLRLMLTEALRCLRVGGSLYCMAHKRQGASTLGAMMTDIFGNHDLLAKSSGTRIIRAIKSADLAGAAAEPAQAPIIQAQILGTDYLFQSGPGLFSNEHVDHGTRMLLETIDTGGCKAILDLGCGYGVIGTVAARRSPEAHVTLIDRSVQAVKASTASTRLNQVERTTRVVLSDGLEAVSGARFDLVLSHFPLHIPKEDQLRLLSEVRDALLPGGRFCLVALSAYRLRPTLERIFTRVAALADTSDHPVAAERYQVLCASRE